MTMKNKIKEFIWEHTSFTDLQGFIVFLLVGLLEVSFMIFLIYILLKVL